MAEESALQLELSKLDIPALKRIAQLWNIAQIGKQKRAIVKKIISSMQDPFYIKGILEKLSNLQVIIYQSLLNSESYTLTLGELSRSISIPLINAEMELGVLKRYFLVCQRKNRERLTNNLDNYFSYEESCSLVSLDFNEKNQKCQIHLSNLLIEQKIAPEWQKALQLKKRELPALFSCEMAKQAAQAERLAKIISGLKEIEKEVLAECFQQGGLLEINRLRELVTKKKEKWEEVVRHLDSLGLASDQYYVDEKFIRIIALPIEVFEYLQQNPPVLSKEQAQRKGQLKVRDNGLDFYLNIKKLCLYISRRGFNLAKSGRIKQVDLRETENYLLRPDINLFTQKSQIYQIEILLPVMRLLDIVRIKREDVVLRNNYEEILVSNSYQLLEPVIEKILNARERHVRYEDIFEPLYANFPFSNIVDECVKVISSRERVIFSSIFSTVIRNELLLAGDFQIKNFQEKLANLRRELTNALFYLQLLGLIAVEYPDRWLSLSELGRHYFKKEPLLRKSEVGGVIINPDLSFIAIPEKLSIRDLNTIKAFAKLQSFDNIYTFQLTKEAFQEGILLKGDEQKFISILKGSSKAELSQNLLFSINDWSRALPLIRIVDECVIVQSQEAAHMELLLGHASGRQIVQERISPTTILIHSDKIQEIIGSAEKLNLIIKLIR